MCTVLLGYKVECGLNGFDYNPDCNFALRACMEDNSLLLQD